MAAGSHFGCPKITFGRISGHFRSIRNFNFFNFYKMASGALLDVRNSLSIAFLAISDQYASYIFLEILIFVIFFYKMAARPFWMSENHFWSHFWPFQINTQPTFFKFFYKMAAVGHFGCPKFTLDHSSAYFKSIQIFLYFNFFTKWLPVAILDVRKSLSISFLSISHRYATLIFWTKWLTSAILDVRISLSMAFLAISDRCAIFF